MKGRWPCDQKGADDDLNCNGDECLFRLYYMLQWLLFGLNSVGSRLGVITGGSLVCRKDR